MWEKESVNEKHKNKFGVPMKRNHVYIIKTANHLLRTSKSRFIEPELRKQPHRFYRGMLVKVNIINNTVNYKRKTFVLMLQTQARR